MDNRKPKVGIMTWYTYRNYGSALQASALYHKVESLGYAPCMIQYQPKGDVIVRGDTSVLPYFTKPIQAVKRRVNGHYVSPEREQLFADYMGARIRETSLRNTYPELYALNGEMDAFICGSDQIWAPSCFDEKYFLSFVEDSGKKVAYAPSVGLPEIKDPAIRKDMAKWISQFRHLSVREQQGAALIRQLIGRDAAVVTDPTLLLDAAQWDAYAKTDAAHKISGDYIVCYFLGEAERYMGYVKALSEKTGMKAYIIPVTRKQGRSGQAVPFEVGPSEFVSLIRNAKYVCTDSFHGMAFSVNYGVPFFVFKRFADHDPKNQNSRILNLLNLVGLSERLVDPKRKCVDESLLSCDFSGCETTLKELRTSSAAYLENALEQATKSDASDLADKPYRITDLCCGCGACAAVCPRKAITICQNADGFEHYVIDEATCVRCGMCRTVCPYRQVTAPSLREAHKLYAVKSTASEVLKRSSSGGIGHELARFANADGAWVCGCTYDEKDDTARHVLISPEETDQLPLLQGSKYIQSISADAMDQISKLPKGEKRFFFGTPCQCAAADKLLNKLNCRENAVLVDLICHGVPSYHLWKNYLKEVNEKHHIGEHPSVTFRQKSFGWNNRHITVAGNGQSYQKNESSDDFYAFFRRGMCDMRTCFDCPYRERSGADIRIGDYWGPRFAQEKDGMSMVIAHSRKGAEIIEELVKAGACTAQEYPLEEYWSVQYPYNHGVPVFRKELIAELRSGEKPLSQLRRDYCTSYDIAEKYSRVMGHVKKLLRRGKA